SAFTHALQMEPGIGGGAWSRAWQIALERKKESLIRNHTKTGDETTFGNAQAAAAAGSTTEDTIASALDEAERKWKLWLEPDLLEPAEGMPKSAIVAICERVRRHALALFNSPGIVDEAGDVPNVEVDPFEREPDRGLDTFLGTEVFAKTAQFADTLATAVS